MKDRKNTSRVIIAALAATMLAPTAMAEVIAIHGGTVWTKPGETPKSNQTILVEDGKIMAVKDGFVRDGADRVRAIGRIRNLRQICMVFSRKIVLISMSYKNN